MLLPFEAAIKSGRGRELTAAPSLWHSEVAADSSSLIPAPQGLIMRGWEVPRSPFFLVFPPISFPQITPTRRGEMRWGVGVWMGSLFLEWGGWGGPLRKGVYAV